MKIPERVRICGVEYAVEYVPNLREGTSLLYGQINYDENTISLSSTDGRGHQHRCITLWHEILHGIREHACMSIENEEEIVEMFAKGIYAVLQDNGARFFDLKDEGNT